MDAVFLRLLNMSIAAGWLILAVIALRLLLRRAPKQLSCILWAAVAVRLICPVFFESGFSLIPSAETLSPDVVRYARKPVVDSGIPAVNDALNPMVSEAFAPAAGVSVNPLQIWMGIAGVVWAIGLAAMLGYAFVSFLRIHGRVREAAPLRDNVRICDAVGSPFILGIVRPRIYLSSAIDEEQIKYVLAHEQAHLKRGDHFWKPFGYGLLAVYWFHPLVWAAYILFCRDIELACDEKVVKGMGIDGRKAYCNALLACSMQRKRVMACPLTFGEVGVKERVKAVLRYRKRGFWIMLAGIAACAAVAVCFLTDPKKEAAGTVKEEAGTVKEAAGTAKEEADTVKEEADAAEEDDGSQVRYLDRWYSREDLSDETIEWLEWYNSLPEEEQLAVSHVPNDLYELAGYGDGADLPAVTEDSFSAFGISLKLPENSTWIQDVEYRQPDENSMEIQYHDGILDADCKLLAVRDGILDLPQTAFDESKEEAWAGWTSSGQWVGVRLQRSADGKQALATWEYEEYGFAILADVPAESEDLGAIPKAALGVIAALE